MFRLPRVRLLAEFWMCQGWGSALTASSSGGSLPGQFGDTFVQQSLELSHCAPLFTHDGIVIDCLMSPLDTGVVSWPAGTSTAVVNIQALEPKVKDTSTGVRK